MPRISAVAALELPHKVKQSDLKQFAQNLFSDSFSDIERLLPAFDNTNIENRNLCVGIDFFAENKTFKEKNDLYIQYSLKYCTEAIQNCIESAGISKEDITDIVFVSTTGLSTPSIDALIINQMKLNPRINRTPVWGLGCAGGVSGLSKAFTIAKADPSAVVMLAAVELCSLTFIRNDLSKSNFIATSLFSDGAAAVLVTGDNVKANSNFPDVRFKDSQSMLYYDSLDVMGWEFTDEGFKVLFSKDIPSIVNDTVKKDILYFLDKNSLSLEDVKNFIIHPGGTKVINAYIDALGLAESDMDNTKCVLKNFGNMSSVTALYVLDNFIKNGFTEGYGLIAALGPGFSSEMILLEMKNK